MRQFIGVLFVLMLSFQMAQGQSLDYKQGIFVKRGFTDYSTTGGGNIANFTAYRPTWELGYTRKLANQLNILVPVRAGVFSNSEEEANNTSFWSLDFQAQYYWQKPEWKFIPYVVGGVGFVKEYNGSFVPQIPVGAGISIKFADQAYLNWQSEYRLAFEEDRNNFQHGIGFIYFFGPKKEVVEEEEKEEEPVEVDSDGDGIVDSEDLCPKVAGLKQYTGCPDTDGDGIQDKLDKCPEISGLREMGGCPDSDGDGVSDNEDDCPNLAGTVENNGCPVSDDDNDGIPNNLDQCPFDAGTPALNGCPDTDGDGVADKDDKCPNVKGPKINGGCPSLKDTDKDGIADNQDDCPEEAGLIQFNGCPDTDGDGIPDSKDDCPQTAGPSDSNGCPKIAEEDKKTLEVAMRAVQFDLGRSTLKQESFRILNQVADIMRRYPDYNLVISGHTDNSGSASVNQRLSEKRAQTCYEYLISRGIPSRRMRHAGYGETRPVADNSTQDGRYLNRRVEFDLVPRGR